MLSVLYMSDLHLESQLGFTVPLNPIKNLSEFTFMTTDLYLKLCSDLCSDCPSTMTALSRDINFRISDIFNRFRSSSEFLVLLGGDLATSPTLSSVFIKLLRAEFKRKFGTSRKLRIVYALGNHELWAQDLMTSDKGKQELSDIGIRRSLGFPSVESALYAYRRSCDCSVIENSVLFLDERLRIVKSLSDELLYATVYQDLIDLDAASEYIVFGGIGFSARNEIYNAYTHPNMYAKVVTGSIELERSYRFNYLHNHICYLRAQGIFSRQPCFCLTHMPVFDWHCGDPDPSLFYFSGHTHKNIHWMGTNFYADNQIGSYPRNWQFKAIHFGAVE